MKPDFGLSPILNVIDAISKVKQAQELNQKYFFQLKPVPTKKPHQ